MGSSFFKSSLSHMSHLSQITKSSISKITLHFKQKRLECKLKIELLIKQNQAHHVAIARTNMFWYKFCRCVLALLVISSSALGLVMRPGNIVISNIC